MFWFFLKCVLYILVFLIVNIVSRPYQIIYVTIKLLIKQLKTLQTIKSYFLKYIIYQIDCILKIQNIFVNQIIICRKSFDLIIYQHQVPTKLSEIYVWLLDLANATFQTHSKVAEFTFVRLHCEGLGLVCYSIDALQIISTVFSCAFKKLILFSNYLIQLMLMAQHAYLFLQISLLYECTRMTHIYLATVTKVVDWVPL